VKNSSKRLLRVSQALVAILVIGAAEAAPPVKDVQPWDAALAAQQAEQVNRGGQWGEHFQGSENVTYSRCQGMSRGANCITPASRKEAARRAAAARAAAKSGNADSATNKGRGGNKK
jgi:hypothetical protein